jgi:hypothetical protein
MEDYVLTAKLDERTTLYVSTLHRQTYNEHVDEDNVGGGDGYFVIRTVREGKSERLDILAKALSFSAAGDLFDLIVGAGSRRVVAV